VKSQELAVYRSVFASWPTPGLLLDSDLVIVDANRVYLQVVGRSMGDLLGRHVFDVFPDAEGQGEASPLGVSMRTALRTGLVDRLPMLSYPVVDAGESVQRWWSVVNIPLLDDDCLPVGLLNAVEDLTELVAEQGASRLARAVAEDLRRQSERPSSDLDARHKDLLAVRQAEARNARRLAALAEVALELAGAETVDELTDVVVQGLSAVGADGGAVAVPDGSGTHLRLHLTDSLGADTRRVYSTIPLDGELPAAVAARTGLPVLLGDRAAGTAFSPEMAQVYATAGKEAWASFPLRMGDRMLGSITVSWDSPQDFVVGDVELLTAFAAQCAQALDRLLRRQAERSAAAVTRTMSEALQRSLLTAPPEPDHAHIVVRYVPASESARVGGDWYDAFLQANGATVLVIGDVVGHDIAAAAGMAQLRGLLRGIATQSSAGPVEILSGLDSSMQLLGVRTLATAVVARLEQTAQEFDQGVTRLVWSNAGHPPPLVIHPDGRQEVLDERRPELLLGVDADTTRSEQTLVLERDATVLLYSDGLIERRDEDLDAGIARLQQAVRELEGSTLDELCDGLIERLVDGRPDDDVALAAIRLFRQDQPRPAEAGPNDVPLGVPPDHTGS
jgi:serine phosphatase RsbU (regulator of sigma subunit)